MIAARKRRLFQCFAALSLFCATLAGAAASHVLTDLDARSLRAFETAVQFQFYHGLALLVIPAIAGREQEPLGLRAAGWLLIAGTILFCGSLYATSLGAPDWLGPLAPIGGACFLAAWLAVAWGVWRLPAAHLAGTRQATKIGTGPEVDMKRHEPSIEA